MTMGNSVINNLSNPYNYLESTLNAALQNTQQSGANNTSAGVNAAQPSDNGELSPLGQVLSQLQQLQQTDPTEYAQLTGQISTNLQNAAGTAQADGNTQAANQLNQLAQDFSNASSSGQLPNIQDLAQAIGGHHGHHHHAFDDSDSNSTSSTQAVSQLFTPLEPNGGQNNSLNPASIILNTLAGGADGTTNG
jgi:hypothetical protein